jgi:hypothetical protein
MLHPIIATADDDHHQPCLQQGGWQAQERGRRAPEAHSPLCPTA